MVQREASFGRWFGREQLRASDGICHGSNGPQNGMKNQLTIDDVNKNTCKITQGGNRFDSQETREFIFWLLIFALYILSLSSICFDSTHLWFFIYLLFISRMNKSLKRPNPSKDSPSADFIPLTSNKHNNNSKANGHQNGRKSNGYSTPNDNNTKPRYGGGNNSSLYNRVYEVWIFKNCYFVKLMDHCYCRWSMKGHSALLNLSWRI